MFYSSICNIGPSGSGKTVLLNVLSGQTHRLKNVTVSGLVRVNRYPIMDHKLLGLISAIIPQDEQLMPSMTVYEILRMAARLKRPRLDTSQEQVLLKRVMEDLGISKVSHTRIGSQEKRGVSGGERKRTNIGTKLITNVPVLFADEATSGLDAYAALSVTRILKYAALTGKTVIATIHSPSAEMMAHFDDVLIFAVQGRVIYHGSAADILTYLQGIGKPCPKYFCHKCYFTVIRMTRLSFL